MTVVSALCFLVSGGILWSCFRRQADIISPGRLFGFIWSLAIGLADLKLSRLQHTWTVEEWMYLLLGPAAFLVGLYGVTIAHVGSPRYSMNAVRERIGSAAVRKDVLFYSIIVLFGLYIIGYLTTYLVRGEIPLFSANPSRARLNFVLFGVGLFLHNLLPIVILSTVYHITAPPRRWNNLVLKLVCLITVVSYSMTLQRFQIVCAAILMLVILYYSTRHLRISTVGLVALCGLVFFYWVSTVRTGKALNYILYIDSQMRFAPQWAPLAEPYMYFIMGLENFTHATRYLEHVTYGYYTFDFATALVGLKHWIASYFALDETPYLYSGYNTYTAFWTYYRDFGIAGLFAIPFGGGIVAGFLYHSLRRNPGIWKLLAYGFCVFLLAFSFYTSQIGYLWFVYSVSVTYLVIIIAQPTHTRQPS